MQCTMKGGRQHNGQQPTLGLLDAQSPHHQLKRAQKIEKTVRKISNPANISTCCFICDTFCGTGGSAPACDHPKVRQLTSSRTLSALPPPPSTMARGNKSGTPAPRRATRGSVTAKVCSPRSPSMRSTRAPRNSESCVSRYLRPLCGSQQRGARTARAPYRGRNGCCTQWGTPRIVVVKRAHRVCRAGGARAPAGFADACTTSFVRYSLRLASARQA